MTTKIDIQNAAGREVVMTRLLDAPPELVFKVWTDPAHVLKWWGPQGFTNTNIEMDVRAGGVWRFTMHGPDGVDFPNKVVFLEVVEPERLVYMHSDDEGGPVQVTFVVIVTFEKIGERTKLTMRSIFESAEILEKLNREFHVIEGGKQHVQRLEEYLGDMIEYWQTHLSTIK